MTDETTHSDDLPTFAALERLSRKGIEERYDAVAAGDGRKPDHARFYLDALRHHDSRRRERLMIIVTVLIAVLTAANAYFVLRDDSGDHGGGRSRLRWHGSGDDGWRRDGWGYNSWPYRHDMPSAHS